MHVAPADKAGTTILTFTVYQGDKAVRAEQFTQDVITIGRLTSSHIRLDDENVSRMHAMIEVEAGGNLHLTDLGSDVGTLVNGERVDPAKGVNLANGDAIVVGKTKLVLATAAPACQRS